jgi:peptide/nickel transport system ATP-binding protein
MGGEIIYKGKDIMKLSENDMRKLRGKEISLVCQDPSSSLNPVYTIGNQIGEAIEVHQEIKNKKEIKKKVLEILSKVGIPDPEKRYSEHPHVFSGGMKQRVMIAIAIACNPNLIIMDEPTTALDVTTQAQVLELTKQLIKDLGASVLLITHNLGIVAEMCDYVYVMYAGSVVEAATVYDVFEKPVHPYTRLLLNAIPKIGGKRGHLANIPGTVPELINLPAGCIFADRCFEAEERCKVSVPSLREISPGHKVACFTKSEEFFKE